MPLARILLIEDSEPDVFLVREALEQTGLEYDLQVFGDGESGVEFIQKIDRDTSVPHPGIILLDLNLPRKAGSQVLECVRKSVVCGNVPVIILTSSDSPKDKAITAQLGATEYFRKPSRLDEFMRLGPLVQRILGGRSIAAAELA
jgi:DNA-binding response OmpR family regulator